MIGIIVAIVIAALFIFASFFVMSDSPESTDIYWYDEKTGLAQCRKSDDIRVIHDDLIAEENRPREVKVIDSRYHSAVENDLESYRKIMSDINPEFDAEFDIVEKPKNAQYFRNKREKYIEKYIEDNTPRWKREGREMCEAIIDEIEGEVRIDPESEVLHLMSGQSDWTGGTVIKDHPYSLLDQESREECDKHLTDLGFEVRKSVFSTRIEW